MAEGADSLNATADVSQCHGQPSGRERRRRGKDQDRRLHAAFRLRIFPYFAGMRVGTAGKAGIVWLAITDPEENPDLLWLREASM